MTRDEAIKMLRLMKYKYLIQIGSIFDTALDMAIEALNDITKWRTWSHTYDNACMSGEPSEDLISRAEAIDALGEEPPVWCDEIDEIAERNQWRADIEAIKSVPSADRPRPIDPTIEVDLESGVVPRSAIERKE